MKRLLFLVMALLPLAITHAQSAYKGTLLNEKGEPIFGANVIQLTLPDSTMVKGAISDDKGHFELPDNAQGKPSVLKITHLEYKEKVLTPSSNDVGTISLQKSVNELGEVVVSAHRPVMKQQGTIITTDIAASTLKNLPNLGTIIDFLPGVSKSFDGSGLRVFGKKNPVYYINNRKVRDGFGLSRINPKEIERIDIDTEPGAEHDNSIGAIIRIILKKKKGDGLSGLVNVQPNFKDGIRAHGMVDLNYRTGNTDFFVMVAPNHNYGVVSERGSEFLVHTKSDNWQVKTSNYEKDNSKHFYTKIGFAHDINEKHSIGASVWTNINPYSGHTLTKQDAQTSHNGILTENKENAYDRFNRNKSLASNLYYEGKLSEKLKLQTDIDYQGMRSDHHSDIVEKNRLLSTDRNVSTNADAESNWVGIKTTFSQDFKKGALSYGFEGSTLSRNEIYKDNVLSTSNIDNKELKSALFATYSFSWEKVSLKAGLRYEYTNFEYFVNKQKRTAQSRVYRNVLPNISFSFPWDNTRWSLSYARKIRRPAFYELSDHSAYSSSFLYNRGNASLLPRLSDDINLLTSYKKYSLAVNYSFVKDAIYTSYGLSSLAPNVIEKTLRNFDKYRTVDLTFSARYKWKFWAPKVTFNFSKQFAEGVFEQNDPIFSIEIQNQLLFSDNWFILMMMHYQSKGSIADVYYEKDRFDMGLIASYSIPKTSSSIFFGVSDIFNSSKNNTIVKNSLITHRNYDIKTNNREVFVGFSYRFNYVRNKYKGQGNIGDKDRL